MMEALTNTPEEKINRRQRAGAYDSLPNSALITPPSESDLLAMASAPERTEISLSGIGKIEVSQDTYSFIQNRLSGILDNAQREAEEIRLASAFAFARNLNIPFKTAYSNLDTLTKNWNGFAEYKPTASNYRAILNSFSISKRSFDRGRIGDELKTTTDPARRQQLLQEAAALEAEIESLQDNVPRNFLVEMAKLSANSAYFSARSLISSFSYGKGTDLAVKAVSAIAPVNPALASLLVSASSLYGGFKVSKEVEGGNLYLDLISNGVEENIARGMSDIGGFLIGAVEVGLDGVTTSWLKALGVPVENFTSKVVTRFLAKGTFGKLGTVLTRTAASAGMEGLEEGIQGIISLAAEDIAYVLSETSDVEPDWNIVQNFASDFIGGFAASVLLGLPASAINTSADFQTVKDLEALSISVRSKESYDSIAAQLKPEGITDEDWKTVTDRKFKEGEEKGLKAFAAEVNQKTLDTTLTDLDEDVELDTDDGKLEGEEEQTAHPVDRMKGGRLYGHETGETQHLPRRFQAHTFSYGSPVSGDTYGAITYRTDRDGNLTITNLRTREGYQNLREEMVSDFISRYPDMNIEWETNTAEEADLKDRLINANPRGVSYGLNYGELADSSDVQAIKSKLSDYFSYDETMNNAMATVVSLAAARRGMTGQELFDRYIEDIRRWTPEEQMEADRGLKPGQHRTGATEFYHITDGVKAVIYAGENANPTTFMHEMTHLLRRIDGGDSEFRTLFDSLRNDESFKRFVDNNRMIHHKDLSTLFTTEEWTEADDEFFTELSEAYWTSGQAGSARLRGFFDRLKRTFRRIYDALKGTGHLNDEIVAYYDNFFGVGDKASSEGTVSQNTEQAAASDVLSGEELPDAETAVDVPAEEENVQPSVSEGGMLDDWKAMRFREAFRSITDNEAIITALENIPVALHKAAGLVRESTGSVTATDRYSLDPRYSNLTEEDAERMQKNAERYEAETEKYEAKRRKMEDTTKRVTYTIDGRTYGEMARISSLGTFTPSQYIAETGADPDFTLSIEADNVHIDGFKKPDPNMLWKDIPDRTPIMEEEEFADEYDPYKAGLDEDGNPLYQTSEDYNPEKIGRGYKLFEQDTRTGKLYPLFIGSREETPVGTWMIAQNIPTKGFANRPGWHIGSSLPDAPWLKGYSAENPRGVFNSKRGKNFRRVWAEVSYPMDVDYQEELDRRGIRDIKDHIPKNGYYTFREANGTWIIAGALRVDRILSEEERQHIFDEAGYDEQAAWESSKDYAHRRRQYEERIAREENRQLFQTFDEKVVTLREKYSPMIAEPENWMKKPVRDFFHSYKPQITEMLKEYPKVEMDGILLLEGMDASDMPFQKELIQARILQEILGKRIILLPRYITNTISDVFGIRLNKGSLSDGLSALADGDRYIEFKLTSEKGIVRNINEAMESDIIFVASNSVTNSLIRKIKERPDNIRVGGQIYLLDENGRRYFEIKKIVPSPAPAPQNVSEDYELSAEKLAVSNPHPFDSKYIKDLFEVNPEALVTYSSYQQAQPTDRLFQTAEDITSSQEWRDTDIRLRDNEANFDIAGRHLAPNGKLSNLSYRDWVTVRTPSFIRWFGDWMNNPEEASKIVDENGEPMAMYHGSLESFSEFSRDFAGRSADTAGVGFWFSDREDFARSFASAEWQGEGTPQVYSVFLNIRNPRVYSSTPGLTYAQYKALTSEIERLFGLISRYEASTGRAISERELNQLREERDRIISSLEGSTDLDAYESFKSDMLIASGMSAKDVKDSGFSFDGEDNASAINERYISAMRSQGYDGIIIRDTKFDSDLIGESFNTQYVAFDPNQIKSVNNRGTFSSESNDILYQLSPEYVRENMDYETKMPTDDAFLDAARNTPGARIEDDGIIIDLERWQKPEQDNEASVRTGVFYLPTGSSATRYYKGFTSTGLYGGSVKFRGETLLKAPLAVRGYTGGDVPLKAYEILKGEQAASELKHDADYLINSFKRDVRYDRLRELAEKYGINDDEYIDISDIFYNSEQGSQLKFAFQENVVAHALRDAGYDSVVGFNRRKLTEVFDVREGNYPSETSDTPWATYTPEAQTNVAIRSHELFQTMTEEEQDAFVDAAHDYALTNPERLYQIMDSDISDAVRDYMTELMATAAEYTDYDEYYDAATWVIPQDEELMGAAQEELDKYIIDAWNRKKNPEAAGTDADAPAPTLMNPDMSASTEEMKDEEFIQIISTDAGFDEWLNTIRRAVESNSDEGERAVANAVDQDGLVAPLLVNLIHPSHSAAVWGSFKGSKYRRIETDSSKAVASAKGILKANAAYYRDLYAKATGSDFWSSIYNDAVPAELQEISADDLRTLSVSERKRLAEDIRDENMKKAILSGTDPYKSEALESLISKQERKIEDARADIRKLEAEKKAISRRASELLGDKQQLWRETTKLQDEIDKARTRLQEISERIAKASQRDFGEDGKVSQRLIDEQASIARQVTELVRQQDSYLRQLKNAEAEQRVYDARTEERWKAANRERQLEKRHKEEMADRYRRDLDRMSEIRAERDRKLQELKAYYRERDSLRKIKEHKQKLANIIKREPSKGVNWEQAEKIRAIQAFLDPNFRTSMMIDGKPYDINLLKAMFRGDVERDPVIFDSLSDAQLDRLSKKSLDEMTISELEDMATAVSQLREEGIKERKLIDSAQRKRVAKTRKMVLAAVMANPKFTDEPMPGSGEERKRERNWWRRFLDIYYGSANMSRRTQDMEGGKKGIIWNLLVGMKREAQDAENRMILKRMQPIQDFIKASHINTSDFYEEFSIDLGEGRTASYRYTDLVYMYLSQNSRRNREAVAYGKLVTQLEKDAIREEVLNEIPGEGYNEKRTEESNRRIRELGDRRYENVIRQAEGIIRDPSRDVLFALVRLIEKDFNSDLFERLREAQQRIYNTVVTKEDYYLPINRTDYAGSSPAESVKQDLLNMIPGNGSVQRGFLDDRNDFSPYRQSDINTDFFGIWQNSVYAQEHALANMEYVRLLKGVFINNGSQAVRSAITNTFGSATMESIENHISLIANPRSFQKMNKDADRIFRFLKGSLYSSYLGLRPRSIITQLITSWAPMWGAVNPIELARGYLAFSSHPIEVWAEICRLSPFMATRSMNPTLEWIKEEASKAELPKWRRGMAKLNEKGMKGLEWADRFSVGAGWWAIFQRERSRLLTEGNLRTDEEIDQAAAKVADDFVQETQPVSDITELSPLFQNRNEALKILTQFQASLNVVWQNVTRDIPNAVRNKQYAKAIGMFMGYAVSGMILYAVQDGLFGDDDDDDDRRGLGWRLLYSGVFSQPISGVPLISNYIDAAAEKIITGESEGVYNSPIFPPVDRVFRTINSMTNKDWEKAAENAINSMLLFTGLPYSAVNDVKKAISWDDNGNVEYHPEVFIGRDPD